MKKLSLWICGRTDNMSQARGRSRSDRGPKDHQVGGSRTESCNMSVFLLCSSESERAWTGRMPKFYTIAVEGEYVGFTSTTTATHTSESERLLRLHVVNSLSVIISRLSSDHDSFLSRVGKCFWRRQFCL